MKLTVLENLCTNIIVGTDYGGRRKNRTTDVIWIFDQRLQSGGHKNKYTESDKNYIKWEVDYLLRLG